MQGFRAAAVAAGLKKDGREDLALIVSDAPASAAGVFTSNLVKAAPVLLSQAHLQAARARAIVANAGCANACTGERGLADARLTAELVAEELGLAAEEVLVASTGVIGQPLNVQRIRQALPGLAKALSPAGIPGAARAIMTTDGFEKLAGFEGNMGGRPYRIVGLAKGAGMIMPDMATMLSFVLTDARMEAEALGEALRAAVECTFNRISVDGDTSTNDTVFLLANGLAGNPRPQEQEYRGFCSGLTSVLEELARMIVRDGEGASKEVLIEVLGAASAADALRAARTVANSSLVKTAFYGQDPNWGRIMAALGRAGIRMRESEVDIRVDGVQIVANGLGLGEEAEKRAAAKMEEKQFSVSIDLHQGEYRDRMFTSDLTHEYVSINAHYRT